MAPAGGQVPTTIRIEVVFRAEPASRHLPVGHADDIEREVMERIATAPLSEPTFVIGPVGFGRQGVIAVPEPPDGIEFIARPYEWTIWIGFYKDAMPVTGKPVGRAVGYADRCALIHGLAYTASESGRA